MIVTRKHLSRRTVLRGLGAAIALPWLDAMRPALARPADAPLRLSFVYIPNGVIMDQWTPAGTGAEFEFPRILRPLEPFREGLSVLSGLDHHNANALGDGDGDHARAAACFLTGAHPQKTAGRGIANGVSADQVAAAHFRGATRFASLELGCEDNRAVGLCDSGYSCAYTNTISWRGPATPLPPEVNPRAVFDRLFGVNDASPERSWRASVLDQVSADARRLRLDLGPSDRRKVDEYLDGVREIEQRLERAGQPRDPGMDRPDGIPFFFSEHLRLMYDLQAAAFQADLTRVATLLTGKEGSTRVYSELGISGEHHPLTHHGGNPEAIEQVVRINTFHSEQFARFLAKLKSIQDGEGTLLDHCAIVYASAIADGNAHTHENLPVLLAGGGAGLRPGRHIRYPRGTPMTNLYMTLLSRLGIGPERIGDSNGMLGEL